MFSMHNKIVAAILVGEGKDLVVVVVVVEPKNKPIIGEVEYDLNIGE